MKFSVKGLKGIGIELNADIELSDMTVVIGPNGSGKTLLVKLLYSIIRALTRPSPEMLYHGNVDIERATGIHLSEELVRVFGSRPSLSGEVELTSEDQGKVSISLSQEKVDVDLSRVGGLVSELYSKFFPVIYGSVRRAEVLFNNQAGGELADLYELVKETVAEARIFGRRVEQVERLGLSVIAERDGIRASLKGVELDVNRIPYGYAQVVPIVLMPRSYRYLIVDEPTLNLHADTQVKLANYLYDNVLAGRRFIITTHSDMFTVQLAVNHVKRGARSGKTLKIYLLNDGRAEEIMYTEKGDIESIPTITDVIKEQIREIYGTNV